MVASWIIITMQASRLSFRIRRISLPFCKNVISHVLISDFSFNWFGRQWFSLIVPQTLVYFSMVFQIWTNCCNNCHGKYGAMNQDMVVWLIIFFLTVPFLYLCKSQSCMYFITFANTLIKIPYFISFQNYRFWISIIFTTLSFPHQVIALIRDI